jgi:hypothetical protein
MTRARSWILLGVGVAAAAIACTRDDSLVLLDLRSSGPLGAPVVRIRLSAKGWSTRTVGGSLGPEGFRVGYYGPANGGAVSVTAEALDDVGCVLGSGSATVPMLASGATSDPTPLFVRPLPANGCVPDAGAPDGGGEDSGGEDSGGEDDGGSADGGTDAADDGAGDAGSDVGADAAADAMDDASDDASPDAGD